MIPRVANFGRAHMRRVEAFRASLKSEAAARGLKLTALAFHVNALARRLQEFPRFNASLTPDGATLALKLYVHIGVAVDTPHRAVTGAEAANFLSRYEKLIADPRRLLI